MSEFKVGDILWHENRRQIVQITRLTSDDTFEVVTTSVAQENVYSHGPDPGYRFSSSEKYCRKLTKLERALR